MAIGTRILSNNLSGQTAEVTFLPFTGGTFDLGTQTIPFNHLTSYPYGTYEVYVPLYDNTYIVIVNQGASGNTFSFVSKLVENNNHGAATLDFNDLTAQVLDLNVDYTGWYIDDIYPITDYGYGYFFVNQDNNCDLQWVIFADAFGNIMESYQTNSDCSTYDYDVLGGKWIYFNDVFNGVLKYFNGKDVYTLTANTTINYIDVNNNGDGVMSNDNFTITIYNINGNASSYIVDGSNLTQFSSFNNNTRNQTIITYFSGSWIGEVIYYDSFDYYKTLNFYDGTDGTLLQTLDLPIGLYTNYQTSPYGDNKIFGLLFGSSEYLIFQYDGNTDTLITTTHPKGLNYPNYGIFSQRNSYPNPGSSEAFLIKLYQPTGSNNFGDIVDYCDFIYMLSGDTDFNTYTFQNSGTGDKTIQFFAETSSLIVNACDDGDGDISILVINSSGVTITSTNILTNNNGYVDISNVGNGFVTLTTTSNSETGCTLNYVNNIGVISDTISGIIFTGSGEYDYSSNASVYQFTNYTGDDYFINEMSDVFQTGNPLPNSGTTDVYYSQYHFEPDFIEKGVLLNFDNNTRECNLLTPTGYTDTFSLPGSGTTAFAVGDDKFMFTFFDLSGKTNIHLYDFDGNLLNSVVTEQTNLNFGEACRDGFVQIINENNNYYIYLVSETEISSSILTDDEDYYTFNDWVWWD